MSTLEQAHAYLAAKQSGRIPPACHLPLFLLSMTAWMLRQVIYWYMTWRSSEAASLLKDAVSDEISFRATSGTKRFLWHAGRSLRAGHNHLLQGRQAQARLSRRCAVTSPLRLQPNVIDPTSGT